MVTHKVSQGECCSSIAFDTGFFWETIWNASENSSLRRERKDHNILLPGDELFIPDKRPAQKSCGTEKRHRFRKKGVPETLKIVLLDENDEPRSHQECTLVIEGETLAMITDGDGQIEIPVSPGTRNARLFVGEEDDFLRAEYDLNLGGLDPISELSGVQARLKAQRFYEGEIDGQPGPETTQAIKDFQTRHGIEPTGDLTDETREKLKTVHGF